MVAAVRRERGALPLLAFAASRLWETRDREQGLLTREAYREIGGVAGALAQHAEATLERIGTQRVALVRELFRNLVTAQGTRAVRRARGAAVGVRGAGARRRRGGAGTLVDARLLTCTSAPERAARPTSRSRSSTSRCSRPGRGSCAGRRRTPTARSFATSCGRRPSSGRTAASPRTCSGPGRPTAISPCGGSATPAALTAREEAFAHAAARLNGGAGAGAAASPRPAVVSPPPSPSSPPLLWRRSDSRAPQRRGPGPPARGGRAAGPGPAAARRLPDGRPRARDREPRARRQRSRPALRCRSPLAGADGPRHQGPGASHQGALEPRRPLAGAERKRRPRRPGARRWHGDEARVRLRDLAGLLGRRNAPRDDDGGSRPCRSTSGRFPKASSSTPGRMRSVSRRSSSIGGC